CSTPARRPPAPRASGSSPATSAASPSPASACPTWGGTPSRSGRVRSSSTASTTAAGCISSTPTPRCPTTRRSSPPPRSTAARSSDAAGAGWIHVVDLDAARSGEAGNLEFVAAIARSVGCDVETGGGVRSVEAAERLIDAGVARVVIGTAAVERPELVTELAARYPGRVAVGLDARGRKVAVKGWTETTDLDLVDLAQRFEGAGVA